MGLSLLELSLGRPIFRSRDVGYGQCASGWPKRAGRRGPLLRLWVFVALLVRCWQFFRSTKRTSTYKLPGTLRPRPPFAKPCVPFAVSGHVILRDKRLAGVGWLGKQRRYNLIVREFYRVGMLRTRCLGFGQTSVRDPVLNRIPLPKFCAGLSRTHVRLRRVSRLLRPVNPRHHRPAPLNARLTSPPNQGGRRVPFSLVSSKGSRALRKQASAVAIGWLKRAADG